MMYVICPRCRTKHLRGTKCPNGCYERSRKESNKIYDKYLRKNADFYNSSAWKRLRAVCHNKYNHICLYSYFKYKQIVKSETVHHIIELEDDKSKSLDINNLIPVCNSAHSEIHSLYSRNKSKAQQELFSMIKKWEKLYDIEG